ncbi:AAA family ATPase [Acidithiobacillus acidisediminis]|uniref:nucleotide-binding protein n=1 Tax=Acidithiobacillus acidisediminis TaxID=2937799 RepID=UPI00200BDD0A|nr:AAA family ATPase [Acidithiobacillus sp. S30A2]
MNKIFMVGGGKGGVGKSTVSMALVDSLLERGEQVLLVESDDSNPDTYKALSGIVPCEICNMDTEEGYIKLGGIIEANSQHCIVINTAARATAGLVKHGGILIDVAKEMNREVIMLWPINRQRDSLELLHEFIRNTKGYSATYVIINTYFGEAKKFLRFNESKLKTKVTGAIEFPELNDLVADKIVDERLALSNADQKLKIAERSALRRYREAAHAAFEVLYG